MSLDLSEYSDQIAKLPPEKLKEFLKLLKEHGKVSIKATAKVDFLSYVKLMWPEFIAGRHHAIMADAFERVANGELKRLIINLAPRHPYDVNTEVPTPNGWTTISNIKTGDFVFGTDGRPTEVVGKSVAHESPQMYRVTTDDGAYVDCDGDHVWTVRLSKSFPKFFEYTTEELWLREQGYVAKRSRAGRNNILPKRTGMERPRAAMLPPYAAIEYPEADLPIPPYTFGLWIGDGSKASGVITSDYCDMPHVRSRIENEGMKTTDQSTRMTFGILKLIVPLREIGVLGNKHIPEIYLTASVTQRMELLRGLMDSDGNVSKKGQCFFAQKDRGITESFAELVRSLGAKASIQAYEAKGYGTHHKVSFYMQGCATLPRKLERTCASKKGRFIRVSKIPDSATVQCIKVAADNDLFMVGRGYISGHNTKSEMASFLLPSWYLGRYPNKKIIQASNTADLAVGFGRKVRNLIQSEEYQEVFPGVRLAADAKAAGRWNTNKRGEYFAIGTGGTVTGKGADLFIIDDPHSESDAVQAVHNPEIYDKVYEWYTSGPRQRLQPGGAIILVQTRWSKRDLSGQLIKNAAEKSGTDQWEVIELPAIMPSGKPLWPEYWSKELLEATKAELTVPKWNAQYQQNPTSEEGAIIKREWWKRWEHKSPPKCQAIIQSWDTAFLKTQRADYSACTTWGVFSYPSEETGKLTPNLILLHAYKAKMEFPELKKKARELYREYDPDQLVVEAKAAGSPLIFELRAMGIPVTDFTPSRGNDKIARANAVSDLFSSGCIWIPNKRWADEVMEECAEFPNGEHDDYVDSTTQALLRYRQGGWIRAASDDWEEDNSIPMKRDYY